jgi:glutamyl-tRNA synthetase
MSRILSINEHYIKTINENELYNHLVVYCELYKEKIKSDKEKKIKQSLLFLKNKAKTLEDIYNNAKYIIFDEINFNQEDLKLIDDKGKKMISQFDKNINNLKDLNKETLEPIVNDLIKVNETNFKGVGQPLRVALTGSKFGPGIYDIIISLGKEEVQKRLRNKVFS